jgi:hypothetical protein
MHEAQKSFAIRPAKNRWRKALVERRRLGSELGGREKFTGGKAALQALSQVCLDPGI